MDDSAAEISAAVPPADKYIIDDTPLTQQEEEMIAKIESKESQPPSSTITSSVSPSRKKRKRPNSASPYLTPSRLRSSVKVTARPMDAGYTSNGNHTFRQEQSSGAAGITPSAVTAIAGVSFPKSV